MLSRSLLLAILAAAAVAQNAPSATPTHARFRISGTVIDALRHEPLPDIEVSIRPAQSDALLSTVATGEDGRFEFPDLPGGKYALTARGRGYLNQAYQEHRNYSTAIVTGPSLQSENLIFQLKPNATISGSVTDEFNEPVAQAQAILFQMGLPMAPQRFFRQDETNTDDTGHFRFRHITEGKYYVVVSGRPWYARGSRVMSRGRINVEGRGFSFYSADNAADDNPALTEDSTAQSSHDFEVAFPTTYYPNATSPEQASAIDIKPGEQLQLDFHLYAVPALHLTVRGMPARAGNLSSAVTLAHKVFGQTDEASSQSLDASGASEFAGLAPGRYELQVAADANHGIPEQRLLDLTADTDVTIGKGGDPLSTVSGTVVLEDGTPAREGAFVRLTSLALGEFYGAQVQQKGSFSIENAARSGSYNINVFNQGDSIVKTISAEGARVIGHQLEIPRGAPVHLTIVLTKGYAKIDGIALKDGKPVSETAVFLVPSDPAHNIPLFRRDQSDSDGTFTLPQVLPGDYTLISIAHGWDLEWTDANALKPYVAGGTKVHAEPNRTHQLQVEVQEFRTVR